MAIARITGSGVGGDANGVTGDHLTRSSLAPRSRTRAARAIALVVAMVATASLVSADAPAHAEFDPLPLAGRLVDTRPGGATVDGEMSGIGPLAAGQALSIPVAGRAGVPSSAASVALNVTVVAAREPGHISVYACDSMRPPTSNQNYIAGETRAVLAVTALADDGAACVWSHGEVDLVVDVVGAFGDGVVALAEPARLVDTRREGGAVAAGTVLDVPVAGRAGVPDGADVAIVGVTAAFPREPGHALARSCDGDNASSTVNYRPGQPIANLAVVPLDAAGRMCVWLAGTSDLVVDVFAWATDDELPTLASPARILDTRPGGATVDGTFSGIGARPGGSTLELPVAGRGGVPSSAGAVALNVTMVAAREPGHVIAHGGGAARPITSNVNAATGETIANAAFVSVGASGEVCLFTHGATDLVVDVVGWLPGPAPSDASGCGPSTLFPDFRMVALYGNDVDARLGVLGEQPPDAAADRLFEFADPYAAGDRPVLGAFELIATIATSFPGPSGLYRAPSSAEHVQRYLDAANANGVHLILDIQPGRGDFLTELRRYDEFLREPNVHAALDPEWNVGPGQVPGQVVGQVSAFEVNEIADYLSGIVAEEGLPEKMLVVHQFQDRMLTDREALREPPGVAVTIHMDGFGTQSQKLATYDVVAASPPFTNGFKLFLDEDIDMFTPGEVLDLDPVPDLITYQ